MAQRTLEQRLIFVNNLAIRRATEELKSVSEFERLCRVLETAFLSNDFDGFELRQSPPMHDGPGDRGLQIVTEGKADFYWKKAGRHFNPETVPAWRLTLDLVAANNCRRGSLTLYRLYAGGDLQLDINLLTSVFAATLADALDRVHNRSLEITALSGDKALVAEARAS